MDCAMACLNVPFHGTISATVPKPVSLMNSLRDFIICLLSVTFGVHVWRGVLVCTSPAEMHPLGDTETTATRSMLRAALHFPMGSYPCPGEDSAHKH